MMRRGPNFNSFYLILIKKILSHFNNTKKKTVQKQTHEFISKIGRKQGE